MASIHVIKTKHKNILSMKNLKNRTNKPFFLLFIAISLFLCRIPLGNAQDKHVRTVVIDAGHGGKDSGCLGSFSKEKDIALAVSLQLGKLIEEHFSDVKVVYTRKTDVFIELYNRAQIANKANADLFICIHVNAGGAAAHGAETFVMGLHKTETNLAVAKRENEAILLEDNYEHQYEGFNLNTPEGNIIFSLYQNKFLNQSLTFAAFCQKYFREYALRYDRGVKQAGFLVLVYTAMPSVLIETGFATNPEDEKFLTDKNGQLQMAESIFQAFVDYKKSVEKAGFAGLKKTFIPSKSVKKDDVPKDAPKKEEPKKEEPKKEEPKKEETSPSSTHTSVKTESGVIFKVQFMSSKNKIQESSPEFKNIPKVSVVYSDNWYRYFAGNETSLESIQEIKKIVVNQGYKDAFIVAYQNGQRISVQEALDILKKNK